MTYYSDKTLIQYRIFYNLCNLRIPTTITTKESSIMDASSNPPLESKPSNDESYLSFDLESMDPEQRQKVEEELRNALEKVSVASMTTLKVLLVS